MDTRDFSSFEGLQLTESILSAFREDGILEPSPVQLEAIPAILEGKHVVLESGTGTGKTLAYLLPILERLKDPTLGRTVVMTPATELALQILHTANRYKAEEITTGAAVSTIKHKRQKQGVTKSTRLIVGTSGRILELYEAKKMKQVTTMVLDESDPILNGKSGNYLREVLSRPEPKVQLIIAAATIGPESLKFIKKQMGGHYVHVQPKDNPLHQNIEHSFIGLRTGENKDVLLARFLDNNKVKKGIIFVSREQSLRHLYRFLTEEGLNPVSLSNERSKLDRKEAIESMSTGKLGCSLPPMPQAEASIFPKHPGSCTMSSQPPLKPMFTAQGGPGEPARMETPSPFSSTKKEPF